MRINQFEDIIAWQKKSKELSILIYTLFRNCKDFSFRDQIQRAAVSVMNNIAEGNERNGNKEFRNFLFISKGSCAEVRSLLILAFELGCITKDKYLLANDISVSISRMLSGLIKTL